MVRLRRIFTDEQLYIWAMEQMAEAFPQEERRDDDLQLAVMSHTDYRLCVIMRDELPVGVAGFWDAPQFVYLENFCISRHFRNGGTGSATLRLLTEGLCKPFILEIELPNGELTCRRKAFYERNGMVANPFPHIQPHYRPTDPDLPLLIMTYKTPLTQAQYDDFRHYLDENVECRRQEISRNK